MAETIIAEFEIGTDQLLKEATEAKKAIEALISINKRLKDSSEDNTEEQVKNEAQLKKLRGEYSAYTKQLGATVNATNDQSKAEATLNNELGKTQKSIDGARKSNKELLAVRNQLDLSTKKGVQAQKAINQQIDKNNTFIKENVSELEKQKIGIGDYAAGIEEAIGKNTIYGQTLNVIKSGYNNLLKPLVQATLSTFGLSKAQQSFSQTTSTSSKALRAFKIALIATGIGAIVVLVGALVAAFASTQEGVDKVNKVLAPLKGALQGLIGVFQKISKNIGNISKNVFGQFKDNFIILKNTMLGGVDQIRLAWNKLSGDTEEAAEIQARITERTKETADAIDRTKDRAVGFVNALKEAGAEIVAAAETQKEIVELGIQIENKENDLILIRGKQNLIIKEQNKIAEDVTKTLAERETAAQAANEASIELQKQELQLSNLRISQKEKELSLNDTSREEQGELNQLIAERDEKATAQLEAQTTITNKLNIIRQSVAGQQTKRIQEAAKADQERIKNLQIQLTLFELQSEEQSEGFEERKALLDEVLEKELEIIDEKAAAGLSENESEILRIQAKQNTLDAIKGINDEERELELERLEFKESLVQQEVQSEKTKNSLLDSLRNERRLLEAETQQEQQQIQLELANQNAKATIENELKNLQEEEQAKRDEKLEFDLENAESDIEKAEIQQEARDEKLASDLEFEESKNLILQELDTNYQLKKAELRAQSDEVEKIAALNNFKERSSIVAKGAEDLLAISTSLFGKSKAAAIASIVVQRALSIAEIVANTGIANAKAVAATPLTLGQPFVTINTISAGLSIGASIAGGAKAIGEINSAKASKGITFQGTLQGNSHANGGIDLGNGIEAEGGENLYTDGLNTMVVNKKASSSINKYGILGALDRLNQGIGGGIALNTPVSYAQSGGTVQRSLSTQSNNAVIDSVNDRIDNIKVTNVAEDTVRVADEGFIVENEANF